MALKGQRRLNFLDPWVCFADREQEYYNCVLKLVSPKTASDIYLILSTAHLNVPFTCVHSFQEAIQALSLNSPTQAFWL